MFCIIRGVNMTDITARFHESFLSLPFIAQRCATVGQPKDYAYRTLDRFTRAGILQGLPQAGRTAARLFTLQDMTIGKIGLHLLGALRMDMADIQAVSENLKHPPLALENTPRVTLDECFNGWCKGENWVVEIMFLRNMITGERKVMSAPCRPMRHECLVPAAKNDDGDLVPLFALGWVAEVNTMLDLNRVFEAVFTDPVPADRVVH